MATVGVKELALLILFQQEAKLSLG